MDMEQIKKNYNLFKIPSPKLPTYDNPEKFASKFTRCSLKTYGNTSYSNITKDTSHNIKNNSR